MHQSYLSSYGPILIHVAIVFILSAGLIFVSWLLGEKHPTRTKLEPYECGIRPTGNAREPFSVKFYLVAILFILFDVEAVFLVIWALIYRQLGLYGFAIMFIFLLLLTAGFVYEWKKGALDWSARPERGL